MLTKETNLFDLGGKVAVISGGTGVLGFEVARYLLRQGAKVALLARNPDKLRQKVGILSTESEQCIGIVTDITDRIAVAAAAAQIIQEWDVPDILINAAGGNIPGAVIQPHQSLFDLSLTDFESVVHLNLQGTVIPSLVFAEGMQQKKRGSIINFSSMSVTRAITRVAGYSAGKAGMENFTRWMACELALRYGDGIRVNAIAPGFFIGEQNRRLLVNPDGQLTDRGQLIIQHTPMSRFGRPEELNGAIHFLSSDASSFVTGTVIPIDGGFGAFSGV
ncbi:MAG: SDR family oxidoreductase [Saprospiraceae bacterium]|jgi:NAD(P)-dependent dehydrogenase (short-subunit alcohol dehydrogenase family)|nr:SDR family oxidoreductase [Saprospiraceae bacterium]MDP4820022.1 SDR family oxidoreductase [Saprospiraceae bacterium]MDP4998900.1 SDR family oxidoreductase [Saprospiraceae bacterium]